MQLPALQDDGPAGDFYGRFSSRDTRGTRGGLRDRRGRYSQGSSSGRYSDNDDDNWGNDSRSRGGRTRRGGSDWLISGDRDKRSSRSFSGGSRDRFVSHLNGHTI